MQDDIWFPPADSADSQGLVAIGGDLSPPRLIKAYEMGIFPWFELGHPILWWSPNPRLVLYPNDLKISKSLKKSLKKPHEFRYNTAFRDVIEHCAKASGRVGRTWITADMIDAYTKLHELGYAHSYELWQDDCLVGGLYGIRLGHAFFGESMFHLKTDASKMALYYLCKHMIDEQVAFIDCQLPNLHLQRLGAILMPRRDFLYLLARHLD